MWILSRRLRTFFSISLFVFLAGCVSSPQSHTPHLKSLEEKKTALVITQGSFYQKSLVGDNEHPVTYDFARLDKDYGDPKLRFFYQSKKNVLKDFKRFVSIQQDYDVFMMEPGIYLLENMSAHIGNTIFMARSTGGVFTVNPGEVLYIGSFQFKLKPGSKGKYELSVIDRHDQAEQYLKENYPDYASKPMDVRLLKVGISSKKD